MEGALWVAVALALLAVSSAEQVQMLEEAGAGEMSMSQELAQVRGDLAQAYKDRDDAIAQMAAMKKALEKKCGAKAAAVASDEAMLASARMAEAKAQALVKADQQAARDEAKKANSAMASARAAVAEKEKAKAALTDAQKQVQSSEANLKAVNAQSKAARQTAKTLAEGGGSDDEIKAAYAKASAMYATVMDAKMRVEMAKKRVQELGVTAGTASDQAQKELLGAKEFTQDAAGKVKSAMRAQVAAAREKRAVAEKQAATVREQETALLKESNDLKSRITAAKKNSKTAHEALRTAKLSESRALEAVKLPSGASPEEKKAFEEAKWKVMSEQQGGTVNYAAKIKNIETKLIDAKEKVRKATSKLAEMKGKKNTLEAKIAGEVDNIQKAKMQKEIEGISGAMAHHEKEIQGATAAMKKIETEQQEQIKDVVNGVVLSEDGGENKANTEMAAQEASLAAGPQ